MLAEFEKVQIVNVSNRNLVDHNMKGIEYASCFETRHLISFLDVDRLDPVINSGSHNGARLHFSQIQHLKSKLHTTTARRIETKSFQRIILDALQLLRP